MYEYQSLKSLLLEHPSSNLQADASIVSGFRAKLGDFRVNNLTRSTSMPSPSYYSSWFVVEPRCRLNVNVADGWNSRLLVARHVRNIRCQSIEMST